MATAKINFTTDHLERLFDLATTMLFSGNTVKGYVGSELTIYDLIHNTTINTLDNLNSGLKKEIARIEGLSRWSLTNYQQKKLEATKETEELVDLLIGYKKYQEQVNADKSKVAELKAKRAELKKSTMTPEQQLAQLDAEIAALGGNVDEETTPAPDKNQAPAGL